MGRYQIGTKYNYATTDDWHFACRVYKRTIEKHPGNSDTMRVIDVENDDFDMTRGAVAYAAVML